MTAIKSNGLVKDMGESDRWGPYLEGLEAQKVTGTCRTNRARGEHGGGQ